MLDKERKPGEKFEANPQILKTLDSNLVFSGWYIHDLKKVGMGDVKHTERLTFKNLALPAHDNTVFISFSLIIFFALLFITLFIRSKLKF